MYNNYYSCVIRRRTSGTGERDGVGQAIGTHLIKRTLKWVHFSQAFLRSLSLDNLSSELHVYTHRILQVQTPDLVQCNHATPSLPHPQICGTPSCLLKEFSALKASELLAVANKLIRKHYLIAAGIHITCFNNITCTQGVNVYAL